MTASLDHLGTVVYVLYVYRAICMQHMVDQKTFGCFVAPTLDGDCI